MTLNRIRHLIARAAHPNTPVEEARSCGVIACRLIVEHKLDLRAPTDLSTPSSGAFVDWLELFRSIFQSVSRTDRGGVSDFMRYARTRPRPPDPPTGRAYGTGRSYEANPTNPTYPAKPKKRRKRRAKRRT